MTQRAESAAAPVPGEKVLAVPAPSRGDPWCLVECVVSSWAHYVHGIAKFWVDGDATCLRSPLAQRVAVAEEGVTWCRAGDLRAAHAMTAAHALEAT